VVVTPSSWDALLWYTTGACADTGACVHAVDAYQLEPERLTVSGVAGTTYYFYVDSFSTVEGGPFTIVVN